MEEEKIPIHVGGPLNACVYRVRDADGRLSVEKDFSSCSRFVRNTLGRFLLWRECWILRRLAGTGAVPGNVRRTGPFALREDFVPGFALRDSDTGVYAGNVFDPSKASGVPAAMLREPVPREFFERLETCVRTVHAAGFVHLDLHNARNVMVGPGWRPVLLDWQSALPTSWMPGPLRRALERIDLAGVCKFWNKFRPGELDETRLRFLHRARFVRRHFWLPRLHRRTGPVPVLPDGRVAPDSFPSGKPAPERPLILHAWAGLANRMLGVVSAIERCREVRRPLRIVWFRDRRRFNARFSELFEPLAAPAVSFREGTVLDAWAFDAPRWRNNGKLPAFVQRLRFGKTRICYPDECYRCARNGTLPAVFGKTDRTVLLFSGCDLNPRAAASKSRREELQTLFRPLPTLAAEIDALAASFAGTRCVGVHVRRGDHAQAIRLSPVEAFEARMDSLLDSGGAGAFFLATDDPDVRKRLGRRYGSRLFSREGPSDRATLAGMRGAVVDLWTLSRCSRLLASAGSTFAPMAAALGGIPCETVLSPSP